MTNDKLFDTLEAEFKELVERIESEILHLENSNDKVYVHSIFRAIHTIKGNSAMVGMENLRNISHSLETIFEKLRSGQMELRTDMMETLLKSIDRMKEIILDLKNESKYEVKDLILYLNKLLDTKDSSKLKNDENTDGDYLIYIEIAKKEKKFLSLVNIDIKENQYLPLNEWMQKINSIDPNILWKGIRTDDIQILSINQTSYPIPFSILLLTEEKVETFIENNNISYSQIKPIYLPEKKSIEFESNSESKSKSSYLKVPTKIVDDLINLAGEAVIARNQLFRSLNLEEDSEEGILMTRVSQFINNIYNRLMKVRLQKIDSIFPRLQRITRDASKSVGKEIQISLDGRDIELDEVVLEGITESLMHIIRNSIDHGIEPEKERIAIKKKSFGEIILKASLQGGNIHIEIKDDGRGLNYEKIKKKALEKGLISQEEIMTLSEDRLADLIFLPGFSTSEQITDVSGRGVGMDIVLTNFKKFGGSLKINSIEGKGTTILGTIPQTLSIMSAFIISVQGNKFAILQKHIVELNKYDLSKIINLDNRIIYKEKEKLIPIIDLGELLFPENKREQTYESIGILQFEEKTFAISFDHIISIEEIVLKPVPNQIKEIDLFGGTTLAGDGSAILLLEPEGLIKFSKLKLKTNEIAKKESELNKAADFNYLAFESSNQLFLIDASSIQFVMQIKKFQIQIVLGKEMIQLEDSLIPAYRIESAFNMEQVENNETMYGLIIQVSGMKICVIIHSLIDMLDSIEIKHNTQIQNNLVNGTCFVENRTALYIKILDILNPTKMRIP